MKRTLLGLLTFALLAAPGAAAQATFADEPITIDPAGSHDLTVTVTAACADILSGGGSLSVDVSTSGLPDWFGAGTATAEFAITDCAPPEATVSKDVTITFTPTADALGLDPYPFEVVAGGESFPFTGPIQVGYADGHTMSMTMDFPYTLTDADEGTLTWDITIDVTANSQTMVMFQNLQTSVGTLSGVNHQIFDVETGDTTRTITATFQAPDFEWEEATIKFWNYSHCLKGTDCPPTNSQNMTWVITNGATSTPAGGETDGGEEESPGLPLVGLLVAVGAAVVVARRRA